MDLVLNRPFVKALAERLTEWYEAFWTAALDEVGPWVDLVHSECFGLVESTSAGVPLWTHLARRSPSARNSASSAKKMSAPVRSLTSAWSPTTSTIES